jgi:hypothetical protein
MIRILPSELDFDTLDVSGKHKPGYKPYIIKFPIIDTGWKVKRWFKIDIEKLKDWYQNLEKDYGDWKFIHGEHKWMWKEDPSDPTGKTGHKFMPDSAWYNLSWNPTNRQGVVPPERSNAKPEFKDTEEDVPGLFPRDCFNGYMLEIGEEIASKVRTKKVVVSILTPGTVLAEHQDAPDKFRFHVAISTNDDAYWIIDGERIQIPADGWVYIVNTSYPHSLYNNGTTPSIKVYGKIYTEDVLKLNLN